jgi:arylsulfatase A-like enzyme
MKILLATLVAMLVTGGAHGERPNVILILVDDMGWGDLACYGSTLHETPNIDRLADQGVRFTDAYAAGPVCSPTRAAIMTGRSPAALQITDWIPGRRYPHALALSPQFTQELPLDEQTVAESLSDAGYACLHVGKWHLGSEAYWPTAHGFHVNVAGHDKGAPATYFHPYQGNGGRVDWSVRNLPPGGAEGDYLTDRLTDEAIALIETHREKPFFLYLSYYSVHTPIEGRADLVAHYRAKAPELKERRIGYAAMVHAVDENVGRLLAALERFDLDERTLVILTSDNGGVPGLADNGPLRAGKGHLYEGGIRVPLIMWLPGIIPPGVTTDVITSSIDLYPTILSAIPGDPSGQDDIEGTAIWQTVLGSDDEACGAVYWHYPHYHTPSRPPCGAVRVDNLKLIEWYEDGRLELYDLASDPGERHDLAPTRPDDARRLQQALDRWRRLLGATMPQPNPAHDGEKPFSGAYTPWDAVTASPQAP